MTKSESEALGRLALTWMRQSRLAFQNAKREPNAMGARLIEHGGYCYFNCAQSLLACAGLLPEEGGVARLDFLLDKFGEDAESPRRTGFYELALDGVPGRIVSD